MELRNEMQWSDEHTRALTEFDNYFNTRYQKAEVVPYTPPPAQLPVQAQNKGVDATTALIVRVAPPIIALTAVASIVGVVVVSAAAVAGAVCTFVTANAMWIGGGALALCAAVGALAGMGGASSKSSDANQPPPNDGGKYEWYQEQRQGWRKV